MINSKKYIEELIEETRNVMELIPIKVICNFEDKEFEAYKLGIEQVLEIIKEIATSQYND